MTYDVGARVTLTAPATGETLKGTVTAMVEMADPRDESYLVQLDNLLTVIVNEAYVTPEEDS